MLKHLNRIALISTIAIIIAFALFQLEPKTIYEIQEVTNETIIKKIDFKTQIYPDYYTEIELEDKDQIVEIFVNKGDRVSKGDLLVQLNDENEQEAYQSAWRLYNQLAKYRNEIRENKTLSDESYNKLQDTLNSASVELNKIAETTEDEILKNSIENEIDVVLESTSLMLETIKNTSATYDPEQIIQPAINVAYSQVEKTKENIEARKIKAPFDCTVIYIQSDKFTAVNEDSSITESMDIETLLDGLNDPTSLLSGGFELEEGISSKTNLREENFIVLSNFDQINLYTDFSESEILEIKEDMNVDIVFESSKEEITGKISQVMNFPINEGSSEPRYGVIISSDEFPENFLIGSNVSGSINIYKKENVLTVPISAVNYNSEKRPYVYQLDDNGDLIEREVVIGNENLTKIEVLEKLEEGDEIVVDEEKIVKRLKLRTWIRNLIQK